MQLAIVPGSGHFFNDDKGQIWWQSDKPGVPAELLADWDSLCGSGPFKTGPDDPFRDDCSAHDNCYRHRAFYELRGFSRISIDEYFLQLMLHRAQGSLALEIKAREYYTLVRLFGGILYYRHITISPEQYGNEELLRLSPEELNAYLYAHPSADISPVAPELPES